ncbi:MAG: hypothetical protein ACE10B_01480, partial [Phycisphaerales bacterium]
GKEITRGSRARFEYAAYAGWGPACGGLAGVARLRARRAGQQRAWEKTATTGRGFTVRSG